MNWISKLKRQDIVPGIYFYLPEQIYHDDVALGSGAMKRLAYSPEDFWFESKMNPLWQSDAPTPAQKYGTALHKMVLEGRQAFEGCYAPVDFPGNVKAGTDERKRVEGDGKLWVKREDWERIQQQGAVIRANPVLAEAFDGGVGSEVSIFWMSKSGIKKKCRIDKLKLRASVDLKSVTNTRNIDFPEACRRSIHEYGSHVQAEHYREGREQIAALARADAVFMHDPAGKTIALGSPTTDALERIAAQTAFAWVLVFCQSTGAPLTWGTKMSCSPAMKNPLLEIAAGVIAKAEDNYKRYMEKFGPETPWLLSAPLEELHLEDFPEWMFR